MVSDLLCPGGVVEYVDPVFVFCAKNVSTSVVKYVKATLTRAQYIRVIMILKHSEYDKNESYVGHIQQMRDAGTCKQRRLVDAFLQ